MKKILLLLSGIFALTQINAQSWQTIFFDDFNRADGEIGVNYTTLPSAGITQVGILSNEVKIASGETAPAYCMVSYVNAINYDSIRISCKYRAPSLNYGFSIGARNNGTYSYRAGIMANSDTIGIFLYNNVSGSTTLASEKAFLDITKTYELIFILKGDDLSFKFVESGTTDTISLYATNNVANGNNINFGNYYYTSNLELFIDDFKIEAYTKLTSIDDINKDNFLIYPNPVNNSETINIETINNENNILNIYNVIGKLIQSEIVQKNQNQINIGNLNNGIYIVEIKSKDWTTKQKLIIKK